MDEGIRKLCISTSVLAAPQHIQHSEVRKDCRSNGVFHSVGLFF